MEEEEVVEMVKDGSDEIEVRDEAVEAEDEGENDEAEGNGFEVEVVNGILGREDVDAKPLTSLRGFNTGQVEDAVEVDEDVDPFFTFDTSDE